MSSFPKIHALYFITRSINRSAWELIHLHWIYYNVVLNTSPHAILADKQSTLIPVKLAHWDLDHTAIFYFEKQRLWEKSSSLKLKSKLHLMVHFRSMFVKWPVKLSHRIRSSCINIVSTLRTVNDENRKPNSHPRSWQKYRLLYILEGTVTGKCLLCYGMELFRTLWYSKFD